MEETDEALTVCTEIRKKRSEKFQSLSRRKKVFLSPSFVIFFSPPVECRHITIRSCLHGFTECAICVRRGRRRVVSWEDLQARNFSSKCRPWWKCSSPNPAIFGFALSPWIFLVFLPNEYGDIFRTLFAMGKVGSLSGDSLCHPFRKKI